MRLRKIGFAAVSMMMVMIAAGCQGNKKGSGDMLAHFAFDEKGGTVISDSTGNLQDAEVHYLFSHAALWRTGSRNGGRKV